MVGPGFQCQMHFYLGAMEQCVSCTLFDFKRQKLKMKNMYFELIAVFRIVENCLVFLKQFSPKQFTVCLFSVFCIKLRNQILLP